MLRAHCPDLAGKVLVAPSSIGDAQNLSALADESVDFVVANHVLEHLEDPIRRLQEMYRVVRRGGALYLAVPDPRATFDVDRDLTSVEHCLDEFRHGTESTRRGHFEDWVAKAEPHVEWMTQARVGTGPERVRELMEMDYSIHFHVWRPDGFLALVVAASGEVHLELELVEFQPRAAGDNEYIFIFLKGASGPDLIVPAPLEQTELDYLRARVAALTGSRSWRLTAPLRAATQGARVVTQRAPNWGRGRRSKGQRT